MKIVQPILLLLLLSYVYTSFELKNKKEKKFV